MSGVSGIKCDKPGCNYADAEVKFEDYPNWINKPCPECGENLLTQQDYDFCNNMENLVGDLKNIPGFQLLEDTILKGMGTSLDDFEAVPFDVIKNMFGGLFGNADEPVKEEYKAEEPVTVEKTTQRKRTRRGKKH